MTSQPHLIEDDTITIDNFESLIADYEVKFSKELVEETEEIETQENPKEVETKEEFHTEEVEDDEADPEVTLDQIIDGVIDSGKIEKMTVEQKYKLFNRIQNLTKKINQKVIKLE